MSVWRRSTSWTIAIISSMTKQEREDPDLVKGDGHRRDRIAKGSGHTLKQVNELVKQFEGMRAMMPHVDEFRPIHNLESLGSLAAALGRPAPVNAAEISRWKEAARA